MRGKCWPCYPGNRTRAPEWRLGEVPANLTIEAVLHPAAGRDAWEGGAEGTQVAGTEGSDARTGGGASRRRAAAVTGAGSLVRRPLDTLLKPGTCPRFSGGGWQGDPVLVTLFFSHFISRKAGSLGLGLDWLPIYQGGLS